MESSLLSAQRTGGAGLQEEFIIAHDTLATSASTMSAPCYALLSSPPSIAESAVNTFVSEPGKVRGP